MQGSLLSNCSAVSSSYFEAKKNNGCSELKTIGPDQSCKWLTCKLSVLLMFATGSEMATLVMLVFSSHLDSSSRVSSFSNRCRLSTWKGRRSTRLALPAQRGASRTWTMFSMSSWKRYKPEGEDKRSWAKIRVEEWRVGLDAPMQSFTHFCFNNNRGKHCRYGKIHSNTTPIDSMTKDYWNNLFMNWKWHLWYSIKQNAMHLTAVVAEIHLALLFEENT